MNERTAIIIPCYQEEKRLNTKAFRSFLEETENVHLVFVDDGSTDATRKVLDTLVQGHEQRAEVLAFPSNRGKGEAVRRGVVHALAVDVPPSKVGYWDADLATPLGCIREFEDILKAHPQVEIVLGARIALLGRRIERKLSGPYLGRVFGTVASLTFNLPVYD